MGAKRKKAAGGTRAGSARKAGKSKKFGKRPADKMPRRSQLGSLRHVDGSNPANLPRLNRPDGIDVNRVLAACSESIVEEPLPRLVEWCVAGLLELPRSERKGVAYIQVGYPTEEQVDRIRDHLLPGGEGGVACLTGSSRLVERIAECAGATSFGATVRMGQRVDLRFADLPVLAVVQDARILLGENEEFDEHRQLLRRRSWDLLVVDDGEFEPGIGEPASRLLEGLPRVPKLTGDGGQRSRSEGTSPQIPVYSEVPPVSPDSSWVMVLLERIQGPIDAVWTVVLIADEPQEEEVDARAWYFELFDDGGPWAFVRDGYCSASELVTPFPVGDFGGMPQSYVFEKAVVTQSGRMWQVRTPEGRSLGALLVRRVARLTGVEVNGLERTLHRAREVPGDLQEAGKTVSGWRFAAPRT